MIEIIKEKNKLEEFLKVLDLRSQRIMINILMCSKY